MKKKNLTIIRTESERSPGNVRRFEPQTTGDSAIR